MSLENVCSHLMKFQSSLFTWKVALYCCRVEVVVFFETLAVDVVECVEADSAVRGCKGQKREKGVEELHYGFFRCWVEAWLLGVG